MIFFTIFYFFLLYLPKSIIFTDYFKDRNTTFKN